MHDLTKKALPSEQEYEDAGHHRFRAHSLSGSHSEL